MLPGFFPASVILTETNTSNIVVSSSSLLKLGGGEESRARFVAPFCFWPALDHFKAPLDVRFISLSSSDSWSDPINGPLLGAGTDGKHCNVSKDIVLHI